MFVKFAPNCIYMSDFINSEGFEQIDFGIDINPIGIIHSPFKSPKGVPIQPSAAKEIEGNIIVFDDYLDGLKDLDGFSHIILIYYFHLVKNNSLIVTPFLDKSSHGVFATRASGRPNRIGLSVVELLGVDGNNLLIKNVDIVDGTPLLDIKPLVPEFDYREVTRIGWLEKNIHNLPSKKDDGRFLI